MAERPEDQAVPGGPERPGDVTVDDAPPHELRAVLRIAPFRKLWIALGLSSLGDWLGLLALTALAGQLAGGDLAETGAYASANFAIAGVLLLRLLPALVIGPLGGYIADRLDRRWTLVAGDVVRFVLFASIPIVGTLPWLYIATLLIEAVSLVWLPAKDAAVPNLVPRKRLAAANQISLATTYGSALPAAALFTLLSLLTKSIDATLGWVGTPVDLALYFNAATFLVGAIVLGGLREVSGRVVSATSGESRAMLTTIVEGWKYVGRDRLVRGLVIGIVGAFATGGVVIGLGRTFVASLQGGDAGYGVLFGGVFLGLAVGMAVGPRVLPGFSRRRLFGGSLTSAGVCLLAMALVQNLVIVSGLVVILGAFAGMAWITGYTMIGLEVEDSIRGRTFAFLQSLTRMALALVLAAAPAAAGLIGVHTLPLPGDASLTYGGAAITIGLAAVAATVTGMVSYRQMDDRHGVPLVRDLRAALSGHERGVYSDRGLFIALEGGEGAGKSTQARLLARWLEERGYPVTLTHQPGATGIGRHLRELVLDGSVTLSPRTEALLFAADKAEHVATMIRPDLDAGKVVITDRYIDSALAYQGGGRELTRAEVVKLTHWATQGLRPHLTILLDLPPERGQERKAGDVADRLEREPQEFHQRVRDGFLELAALDPDRYLVVDATADRDEVAEQIREAVEPLLGLLRSPQPPVGDAGTEERAGPANETGPEEAGPEETEASDTTSQGTGASGTAAAGTRTPGTRTAGAQTAGAGDGARDATTGAVGAEGPDAAAANGAGANGASAGASGAGAGGAAGAGTTGAGTAGAGTAGAGAAGTTGGEAEGAVNGDVGGLPETGTGDRDGERAG